MEAQLVRAVSQVMKGQRWAPRPVLERFITACLQGAWNPQSKTALGVKLSKREEEVLAGIVENLQNKEIAARLDLSETTIKFHVKSLFAKFKVSRRGELLIQNSIVSGP
jgi:DNA-binding NarL/FixJ family response regulator